ncbi:hypothetical protein ACEPAG_7026 [Sanghuangporus baumii]
MSASIKVLPALPNELWTCIFRWATIESACPLSQRNSISFGWPYNPAFDAAFFLSLATKLNLRLVSRLFFELASSFRYETLYFKEAEQAIKLAEQCRTNLWLVDRLHSSTRSLCVVPVFTIVSTERDVEDINTFLQSLLLVTQMCAQLRDVLIEADTLTLFHEPTYQRWVQILSALPSGLHHLAAENFLLGPVSWNPPLFNGRNMSSELRTLRLDAEHPPFEHYFPSLTHLWIFSWPTASKWDMPSLECLYIDYFPGNDSTSSFCTKERPYLKKLHFGGDTDFGFYFPDLPQRLRDHTPNLKELEYHCSGDLDILWDPEQLSQSVERVTIRLEDAESYASTVTLKPEDILLQYTSAGFGILLELLTDLCPSGSDRWLRIERHLEKYSSHPAKIFVLLPKRAASLLRLDDPPPLITSSRVSTI